MASSPRSAEQRGSEPILRVQGVSKNFGGIAALKHVSFDMALGEVRAICGENGAGKSTLVKIITGVYRPDEGSVSIAGDAQPIANPRQAQARGVAFVAQELSLCPDLSVEDNIWLGALHVPLFHKRAQFSQDARAALELLGAGHIRLDQPVSSLTMGERQLVEIARMLTRDAQLLILDEPTATLSDVEIERIFAALLALKGQGKSVIYITHRLAEVFQICDSVTVLRNGEHIVTRPVEGLDRKTLIELMLGRSFQDMYPQPAALEDNAALVVESLHVPGSVREFSLRAPRGKIVCIAGQVGSGAAEVVNALAGLTYDARGDIRVHGQPLALGSTARALALNIMFISGDRAAEGVFRRLNVFDNLTATRLGAQSRWGLLSRSGLAAIARDLAAKVGVDRRRLNAFADELSGGNQQKLAFGRCIDRGEPGVLVMNEPTRGVDVGARADIYRIMREFCAQGHALVMASSDLEEIVGLADLVITMYRGEQVGLYAREDVQMHRLVADITHPIESEAH